MRQRGLLVFLISALAVGLLLTPAAASAGTKERYPSYVKGQRVPSVKEFQKRLAKLGYKVPRSGRIDDGTLRAVLAYRKVNRMGRKEIASKKVTRRVWQGKGAFKLRYPKAGKHAEVDLKRQVLVLARKGKPEFTYPISSGTPWTPTVRGMFRLGTQRQPGYNAKAMYYSVYFYGGYAIHGFDPVPIYPASHGCVRIPIPDAVQVYNWIDDGNPIYIY